MINPDQPEAGPSTSKALSKPKKPNPNHPRPLKRKRPPQLPASPTHPSHPNGTTSTHPHLPIKTLQGLGTKRTDGTKVGYGREVIFVTRKLGLGALMGRCRSLVIDEGYTHLILHSLGAAIPHALLLLHAILDMLPFSRGPKGIWYEIFTGTTECIDDVEVEDPGRLEKGTTMIKGGKKRNQGKDKEVEGESMVIDHQPITTSGGGIDISKFKSKGEDKTSGGGGGDIEKQNQVENNLENGQDQDQDQGQGQGIQSWLKGIGSIDVIKPITKSRMTSSIKINIYIGPKSKSNDPTNLKVDQTKQTHSKPGQGRARPNKKRRQALQRQLRVVRGGDGKDDDGNGDKRVVGETGDNEEDMFNGPSGPIEQDEEEDEAEEEVEMR